MVNPPSVKNSAEYAGDDDEINLLDLLGVIVENLRLLIIGPILAGLIALAYANSLSPIYTAKATIIPPGQSNSSGGGAAALLGQLGGLGGLASGVSGMKTSADQYVAYLESNTLLDQLTDQLKLSEYYKTENHKQARQILKGSTKITADKKTGLIFIEASDSDPQFAANIANAYVGALGKMLGKMAMDEAKYRRKLLEEQINEVTEKSFRSPLVREAVIQSVVREYETAILDQKKDRAYIQLIDIAEKPQFKSSPKRAFIVIRAALATGFLLLLFVFCRKAFLNAKRDPGTKLRMQIIFTKLRRQFFWQKNL
jgi:uncharacterized protein involved in exopolysaccharide biosynthesis